MKKSKEQETPIAQEPVRIITVMEPWEERYFPHLVDELKAIEFAYSERKRKIQLIEDNIIEHRMDMEAERKIWENEILQRRGEILDHEVEIENELKEKAERRQKTMNTYNKSVTDLLDGFHLGMWYRENRLGPTDGYFINAAPEQPAPLN